MARTGRLEGRACVIVGGTGGIGAASARRFLDEGARVAITGRTSEEVEKALQGIGPSDRLIGAILDVDEPADVEQAFGVVAERLGGRIDVLLHVAGISGRRFGDGPLHECTVEGWDRVLQTNARGVFATNRAAVVRMRLQPIDSTGLRGSIVNVGSVLADSPSPRLFGTVAYAASKGAIAALSIAAAAAYAAEKIRLNVLSPGLIDTPMAARALGDPEIRRYLESKQPMGASGDPEDCAEAALFLAEPATRFITGQVLHVEGGWRLSEGPA